MNDNTIDGDILARVPLAELKEAFGRMPAGSTLRQAFASVIRVVAVQLIAGAVPDGMNTSDAVNRGRDLLALLADCTKI